MKRITLISITLLYAFTSGICQSDPRIFKADKLVWAGLDFSKAKLIGSSGFNDPVAIVDSFFEKWNQLIITEAKKYDFSKAYQKDVIINDLSIAEKQNRTIKVPGLIIDEPYSFKEGEIEAIVKQYSGLAENSGVGLLYIVEYFSKMDEQGSIYVVFFDLATQEVLQRNHGT